MTIMMNQAKITMAFYPTSFNNQESAKYIRPSNLNLKLLTLFSIQNTDPLIHD